MPKPLPASHGPRLTHLAACAAAVRRSVRVRPAHALPRFANRHPRSAVRAWAAGATEHHALRHAVAPGCPSGLPQATTAATGCCCAAAAAFAKGCCCAAAAAAKGSHSAAAAACATGWGCACAAAAGCCWAPAAAHACCLAQLSPHLCWTDAAPDGVRVMLSVRASVCVSVSSRKKKHDAAGCQSRFVTADATAAAAAAAVLLPWPPAALRLRRPELQTAPPAATQ